MQLLLPLAFMRSKLCQWRWSIRLLDRLEDLFPHTDLLRFLRKQGLTPMILTVLKTAQTVPN